MRFGLILAAALALLPQATLAQAVIDYGDPGAARLAGSALRYVQIGDSHTASGVMAPGNGMGWIPPLPLPGQAARVTYRANGWRRIGGTASGIAGTPFGGAMAVPVAAMSSITVLPKTPMPLLTATVSVRRAPGSQPLRVIDTDRRDYALDVPADGRWHLLSMRLRPPFLVASVDGRESAIGGWWLDDGRAGFSASAGINGAQAAGMLRWQSGWAQALVAARPNVVALAFGTNEAFGGDEVRMVNALRATIAQIRASVPGAAVLLIGAPESLTASTGQCGTRPAQLTRIQRLQQAVAQEQRTLYWDWQAAQGGPCSMRRWQAAGLAGRDGVHFTAAGYRRFAMALDAALRVVM